MAGCGGGGPTDDRQRRKSGDRTREPASCREIAIVNRWISGEWAVQKSTALSRRTLHYWLTVLWLTVGTVAWVILRDALWFVGFMSLYAIWITHLAGWAAETPVEPEDEAEAQD